jgi:hypothetical protein
MNARIATPSREAQAFGIQQVEKSESAKRGDGLEEQRPTSGAESCWSLKLFADKVENASKVLSTAVRDACPTPWMYPAPT